MATKGSSATITAEEQQNKRRAARDRKQAQHRKGRMNKNEGYLAGLREDRMNRVKARQEGKLKMTQQITIAQVIVMEQLIEGTIAHRVAVATLDAFPGSFARGDLSKTKVAVETAIQSLSLSDQEMQLRSKAIDKGINVVEFALRQGRRQVYGS